MLLGSSFAIWQARTSVNREIASSIHLALEFIARDFSQAAAPQADWPALFNSLKQARHLSIELKEPSGRMTNLHSQNSHAERQETPPSWFVGLVKGTYPKVERPVKTFDGQQLLLVIQANPLDEISEAWDETITFLASLSLLTALIFFAVNLVFNKAFRAITLIVDALKIIETGQYQHKLPDFTTREYDSIAKAINHMTTELAAAQQENHALTLHSLAIQEAERQRLSQELHDEFGQSLTAIKVMSVTAARKPDKLSETTTAIMHICDHLIGVVRTMMRQLHPLVLTELGLKASVEDLINHWSNNNPSLKITLTCPETVAQLDPTCTIQIFRVVQECLTNIVRHAHARKATINLALDPSRKTLHLEIADDGRGCTPAELKLGFGLRGMRERINSLGGKLSITTQPSMHIHATIPLP